MPVRLTVVPNPAEAEVVCSALRAAGIQCAYRATDIGVETLFGGWQEVLVEEADLERGREIVAQARAG